MQRRLFHVLLIIILGLIGFAGLAPASATGGSTTYSTTTDKKVNGADSATVDLGATVTVTIKAKAYGPTYGKQTLTIRDELPSCLDYVEGSASPAPASAPAGAGGVITWPPKVVTNGSYTTVTFQAKAVTAGTCTNKGYTKSDKSPESTDKVVITIKGKPDASADKSCTPDTVAPGGTVDCSLKVTNVGTGSGTFTAKDDMDPGLTYVAGSSGGGFGEPTVQPDTPSAGRTTLTWNLGTIGAGLSKTVTFQQRVPLTGGPGTVTFTDIGSGTVPGDPNPNNDKDPETTTVIYPNPGNSDPTVSKSAPGTANPNQEVTHTLSFSNTGTVQATGVTIEDTLGTGLTFVAGSATLNNQPIVPSQNGQVLTFAIGNLNGGASGTISYRVRTAATWPSSGVKALTDTAVIKSQSVDDNPSNNSSTATTNVSYQPKLTLTKDGCRQTVVSGGYQTYTLSFGNSGTAPATSVTLVDTVPANQQIAEAPGADSIVGQVVTWNLGNLAPGAASSRELTTLVLAPNGSTVTNSATIDGSNTAPLTVGSSTPVSNAGAATSGKAYELDVRGSLLGLPVVLANERVRSQSSAPSGTANDAEGPVINVTLPGIVSLGVLSSASSSSVAGGAASTTSSSKVSGLNLLGGAITATTIQGVTQSVAGPLGAESNFNGTTFENLVIGGNPITDVEPNTPILVTNALGLVIAQGLLNEQSISAEQLPNGNYKTSASVNMIRLTVLIPLPGLATGASVIVGHSESTATYPSGRPCAEIGNTVSGKAFTAYARNVLLGLDTYVSKAEITPLGGNATANVPAALSPVVTSATANNSASGSTGNPPSGHASSQTTGVNVLGGAVTADVVHVTSDSEADGSSADTEFTAEFVNLRVGGILIDPDVPANTVINLPNPGGGIISVTINEQVENGDGTDNTTGTINAIHVRVLTGTALETEVIVASAHSDAHRG